MRKYWLEILALGWTLLIVYGSLIPFDFSWDAEQPDTSTYFGVPLVGVNFPDVASNIAMYAPLGLLLSAFFVRRGLPVVAAILATLVLAGVMGYSMELVQKFIVSRVASVADVLCNIIGAGVGVALYAPEFTLARRCVGALKGELADSPSAVAPIAWGFSVTVMSLSPFDLTFDVSHLVRSFRMSYFMPFAKHAELVSEMAAATSTTDTRLSFAAVNLWNLRFDYVADVLLFAILGMLVAQHLRAVGHQRVTALLRSCAVTIAAAVFLTGVGLFVMSVGLDSTRFMTRISGGVLGAVFHFRALRPGSIASSAWRSMWRGRVRLGVCVWVVYIIARELLPFEIDTSHAGAKVARIEWMPMHAYSLALLPLAATDAIFKSWTFITLGVGIALMHLIQGEVIHAKRRVVVGFATGAMLGALEFAQCWLPGRVPAVTDCILAAVMVTGGMVLGEVLYKFHLTLELEAIRQRADRAILNVQVPAPSGGKTPRPLPASRTAARLRDR